MELDDVPPQELAHERRDVRMVGLQREMASVEQMDFRLWQVPSIGFCSCWQEVRIMPTPNRQEGRSMRAEIGLEQRVERHVAAIVENEVELDLIGTGAAQIGDVECVAVG